MDFGKIKINHEKILAHRLHLNKTLISK